MSTLEQYKCPSCGGAVLFNTDLQQLVCSMCSNVYSPTAFEGNEELARSEEPDNMSWSFEEENWQEGEADQLRTYSCPSCGGEVLGDETIAATSCPYCDNSVIVPAQFSGDLKPDIVLPFKLDKEAAKTALKRHMEGKRFVPKIFKDQHHIDEIKGVYVPFWLFDADVDAKISYEAIRTRMWSDSNFNYTETNKYAVYREGSVRFEKIPVDGSSRMSDDLMESIEPFDCESAVPFDTAYLSGFLANRYDVDSSESIERANTRIKTSTEQSFMESIQGYDSVRSVSSSIKMKNGDINYALFPVWILNTKWQDQLYTFAMNGQSGKLVGNLPLDKKAYWRTFLIMAALLTGLIFLLFFLLW
ncbi:MAG: hypothetical protein GXY99_01420 [Clostridiaceae bacterium]|nr:hypothetical protein [Clostridiaceae bacterium]